MDSIKVSMHSLRPRVTHSLLIFPLVSVINISCYIILLYLQIINKAIASPLSVITFCVIIFCIEINTISQNVNMGGGVSTFCGIQIKLCIATVDPDCPN